MMFHIADVLKPEQVAHIRKLFEGAQWVDGRGTAGHQAARIKNNQELKKGQPAELEAGALIRKALEENRFFSIAAIPFKVSPPLFNRYEGSQSYGVHIDNAIRQAEGHRMRSDLSATLFLCDPSEYDGGELCVEEATGQQKTKLSAGHMVLYPASTLHEVKPVTRGVRLAAFFWVQSMVREEEKRNILLDLELSVQRLYKDHPDHPSAVQLTGVYNNLLRLWAEV
jgi:PKHD-type hydroxylase